MAFILRLLAMMLLTVLMVLITPVLMATAAPFALVYALRWITSIKPSQPAPPNPRPTKRGWMGFGIEDARA